MDEIMSSRFQVGDQVSFLPEGETEWQRGRILAVAPDWAEWAITTGKGRVVWVHNVEVKRPGQAWPR